MAAQFQENKNGETNLYLLFSWQNDFVATLTDDGDYETAHVCAVVVVHRGGANVELAAARARWREAIGDGERGPCSEAPHIHRKILDRKHRAAGRCEVSCSFGKNKLNIRMSSQLRRKKKKSGNTAMQQTSKRGSAK